MLSTRTASVASTSLTESVWSFTYVLKDDRSRLGPYNPAEADARRPRTTRSDPPLSNARTESSCLQECISYNQAVDEDTGGYTGLATLRAVANRKPGCLYLQGLLGPEATTARGRSITHVATSLRRWYHRVDDYNAVMSGQYAGDRIMVNTNTCRSTML